MKYKTVKDLLNEGWVLDYDFLRNPDPQKDKTRIRLYNDQLSAKFIFYHPGIVDVNDSRTIEDIMNKKVIPVREEIK